MGFSLTDLANPGALIGIDYDPVGDYLQEEQDINVNDPLDLTGEAAEAEAVQAEEDAAAIELQFGRESLALQRDVFDWQKEQTEPWSTIGLSAFGQYQEENEAGFDTDVSSDPLYSQRIKEQEDLITRSGAGRGGLLGGGTLRSLRDMTANEMSQSYNRSEKKFNDRMSRLSDISRIGQASAAGGVASGSAFSASAGNTLMNIGAGQGQALQNIGMLGVAQQQTQSNNIAAIGSIFACSRDYKENYRSVESILPRIKVLTVEAWDYKEGHADEATHIGPYAEQFQELFGVGNGKEISAIDAFGVCLLGIKELLAREEKRND